METASGPHSSRVSSQPFPFSLILPAEGHWQNEQVTSLSPMLLADQLDSSTVTLVCVDVLYILYQLSWDIRRHWLFHLKIFAMRGFWVCLVSWIYSQLFVFALLKHVGGNLWHFPGTREWDKCSSRAQPSCLQYPASSFWGETSVCYRKGTLWLTCEP